MKSIRKLKLDSQLLALISNQLKIIYLYMAHHKKKEDLQYIIYKINKI